MKRKDMPVATIAKEGAAEFSYISIRLPYPCTLGCAQFWKLSFALERRTTKQMESVGTSPFSYTRRILPVLRPTFFLHQQSYLPGQAARSKR